MNARSGARGALRLGVFVEAPLLFVTWLAWFVSGHGGGGDFAIFRHAGQRVLHGHSPYIAPTAQLLSGNDRFVYPTPFAVPFVPFAFLSERIGAVAFLLLSAAAVLTALKLLGVSDRRCYGAAILSAPVFGALGVGALGPFLLLLVAGAWKWRDRPAAGILLALAAAAKLFLWPVLVWLVVTRRLRGAAAAAAALGCLLGLWTLLDAHGLALYPHTVRVLNELQRWKSYSAQTLAVSLGLPGIAALAASSMIASAGVLAVVLCRRNERRSFALAVTVALLGTPILWLHYLVLLFVPLALFRPRLSALWVVPMMLWVTPHPESLGSPWRIGFVLSAILVTGIPAIRSPLLMLRREPGPVALGVVDSAVPSLEGF